MSESSLVLGFAGHAMRGPAKALAPTLCSGSRHVNWSREKAGDVGKRARSVSRASSVVLRDQDLLFLLFNYLSLALL